NVTFMMDNEPVLNNRVLQDERKRIYNFFNQNLKMQNYLRQIENDIPILSELVKKYACGFYKVSSQIFKEENLSIENKYRQYIQQVNSYMMNHFPQNEYRIFEPVLKRVMEEVKKPVELLTSEEFDYHYFPISYKNNFLINNLTKMFADYWEKWELNSYNQYRNEKYNEVHKTYSNTEFINEFGEKPWDIINDIINTFGNLEYKVNSPKGLERGHDYKLNLISRTDPNVIIDFDRLSSGEKIMMALVVTLYKTKVDNRFPRL